MDTFGWNDVTGLVGARGGAHVSIFLSGEHPSSSLRRLLGEAEDRLAARGVGRRETLRLLKAGQALLYDNAFWRHPTAGLALFFAEDFFRSYRLDLPLPAEVVAGDHFALRPLLSLLHPGGPFYVLALSMNQVRLLEATRLSVRRIALPGVPAGLRQALGDPWKREGSDLDRGLLRVARAVEGFLASRPVPLVLAARAPFAVRYRAVANDPRVLEEGVFCDPDAASDSEVSHLAWRVVEPRVLSDRETALRRYAGEPAERHLLALGDILPAAEAGKVEVLFLSDRDRIQGAWEPAAGRLEVHEPALATDEDLLDLAAQATLVHGGTVFTLEPARMPEPRAAVAIRRA